MATIEQIIDLNINQQNNKFHRKVQKYQSIFIYIDFSYLYDNMSKNLIFFSYLPPWMETMQCKTGHWWTVGDCFTTKL